MANRFGRNQKRKLQERVLLAEQAAIRAQRSAIEAQNEVTRILRDQLSKGVIPLEVEHFLDRNNRDFVLHAIFDDRRKNLHCQHMVSPHELQLQRDKEEREALGRYLGRAIADRLAEAYSGRVRGTSRAA